MIKVNAYTAQQMIENLKNTPELNVVRVAGDYVVMTDDEFEKTFGVPLKEITES